MLLYFSFYRQSKNHNQKSCHTGNSHHASSDCSTTASIAEYSLCSKGRKTGIELLYGQMRSNLNSFVLGCKYFWSKSAIFKNRSTEFCSFFWKPTTKPEMAHWLIALLTSYMQPVCSFTLYSIFHFFTAGHSSTPSRTLCHLAHSLCWQSSRRSPIKHDFLHPCSYPWRNHCEIRAPRTTLRFVFHGICDFKYYHYFLLLKMKSDPIAHWPRKNTLPEHRTLLDSLKWDWPVCYPEEPPSTQ